MAYYTNLFLLTLKTLLLFLDYILFVNHDVLKVFLAIFIGFITYQLRKPKKSRFNKLSKLKAYHIDKIYKYTLLNPLAHIYNGIYIVFYSFLFFFGFLWLRFKNTDLTLDLLSLIQKAFKIFIELTWFQFFLNSMLFGFFLFFLITFMGKLRQHYYFHIIRKHFYLCKYPKYVNFHHTVYFCLRKSPRPKISNTLNDFFHYLALGYHKSLLDYTKEEDHLWNIFAQKYNKFIIFFEYTLLSFIVNKLPYVILLTCCIYDILFNNFTLILAFKILPYIFLYNIYSNIYNFFAKRNMSTDCFISDMFYKEVIILTKDKNKPKNELFALIDGEYTDISHWLETFYTYEKDGFQRSTYF